MMSYQVTSSSFSTFHLLFIGGEWRSEGVTSSSLPTAEMSYLLALIRTELSWGDHMIMGEVRGLALSLCDEEGDEMISWADSAVAPVISEIDVTITRVQ